MEGHLVGHGHAGGLEDLPLHSLLSFVWWYATHNLEEEEKDKFRTKLWQPPKGSTAPIHPDSPWSPENEMKSFQSLRSETGA